MRSAAFRGGGDARRPLTAMAAEDSGSLPAEPQLSFKEIMERARAEHTESKNTASPDADEEWDVSKPPHPAVSALTEDAFSDSAPALRTCVVAAERGEGQHEVKLLWSPNGAIVERDEDRQPSEVMVGKIEFSEGIPGKLERVLGARVAYLKHVVVLPQLRGHGGGDLLVHGMVDILAAAGWGWGDENCDTERMEGCDLTDGFVALRHTDLGSGKLVNWYSELGFEAAHMVSAELKDSGKDLMIAKFGTMLTRIKGEFF